MLHYHPKSVIYPTEDYGVNKQEGFGVTLRKAGDPSSPTSPRVNNPTPAPSNNTNSAPTNATSPRKTGGDMFNPPKKEWAYKNNPNAGLSALSPPSTKVFLFFFELAY